MDRRWWTLVAVCAGTFMLLLDVAIVNVALQSIEVAFHARLSDIQWMVDAYALTLASLLLTAGSLADRYGARLLYGIGLSIFTAGSLACGLAPSTLVLIIFRAVQGIGGAVMLATGLALIAQAFRGRDRGTAFGIYGMVTGVALAAGPVLGGLITSELSWRWIFFVNVPVGVVALLVTATKVVDAPIERVRRPDWAGFVSFSLALGLVVFGLIRIGSVGLTSPVTIGCFGGGVAAFVTFVVTQSRSDHPMIPLALLRKPAFVGGLIAAFASSGAMFSVSTYVVVYFQSVLGFSPLATGERFIVMSSSIFIVAGLAGRATRTIQVRLIIGPGFLLMVTGVLLMRGITVTSSWTHLVPGLVATGVGVGLVSVPLASTAIGVVEPAMAGVASGINSTMRQVGTATGIAALGTLLASADRSAATAFLKATPLRVHAESLAVAAANSTVRRPFLPPALERYRPLLAFAAHVGYVHGLNDVLLASASVAFVGAVASLCLIRQRDFVTSTTAMDPRPDDARVTTGAGREPCPEDAVLGRPVLPQVQIAMRRTE